MGGQSRGNDRLTKLRGQHADSPGALEITWASCRGGETIAALLLWMIGCR